MANRNWYKGIARVKSVMSGDTVLLIGAPNKYGMDEKVLVLSGIEAPKVRNDSLTSHAVASRDYLRQLLIGELVVFVVTHESVDYIYSYRMS